MVGVGKLYDPVFGAMGTRRAETLRSQKAGERLGSGGAPDAQSQIEDFRRKTGNQRQPIDSRTQFPGIQARKPPAGKGIDFRVDPAFPGESELQYRLAAAPFQGEGKGIHGFGRAGQLSDAGQGFGAPGENRQGIGES